MPTRDDLLDSIAREQALIARLQQEREQAEARVRSLQEILTAQAASDTHANPSSPPVSLLTSAMEKVAVFRRLFRGRDDIFPKLWVNPRTAERDTRPPAPTNGCAVSARSHASGAASAPTRRSFR